jgi:hypothetical protein
MRSFAWAAALGVAVAVGCDTGSKAPATPEQLRARLEAATAINSPTQKDEALAAVAADAATAGEGEVAKQAVSQINSPTKKDETASAAALKLSERGQDQAAAEVAKMISSPTKRDEVLQKIARGRP